MTWVMRGYRKDDHERRDASQRLNPFLLSLLHAICVNASFHAFG